MAAYSPYVGVRDLTMGFRSVSSVRAAGGIRRVCGTRGGPARDWFRRTLTAHRLVASFAASAALYACAMAYAVMHQPPAVSTAAVTIATVIYVGFAVIPILRWLPPWLLVAVVTAGAVATLASGTTDTLVAPALVAALFIFSAHSERTPVIVGTAAVVGVLLTAHLGASLPAQPGPPDLAVVPWTAVAAAVGQAVRSKRAHQAMLEERARRAEEGREQEMRRRVQEERLRIARELHDAVGHHVALISVQAGAMGYLLDSDLTKARESLAHIRQASEAALEELRLTVGLLRQPGDSEPTEPAGGLGRLDELIDSFGATGLLVTCDLTGDVRQLPEAVDLTAFRVIQESLTNTAKHAAGATAAVRLAFRPEMLALAVEDNGPATVLANGEDCGEGHGIIGMRERAAALGGWLTAGPRPDGGFRVLAELPAPSPAPAGAGAGLGS
jgi:signal transduction histidine kinase